MQDGNIQVSLHNKEKVSSKQFSLLCSAYVFFCLRPYFCFSIRIIILENCCLAQTVPVSFPFFQSTASERQSDFSLLITHGGDHSPFKIIIANMIAEWLLLEKAIVQTSRKSEMQNQEKQQLQNCYLWSCQWLTPFFLAAIMNWQFNFTIQLLPTMSSGIR